LTDSIYICKLCHHQEIQSTVSDMELIVSPDDGTIVFFCEM
jgi:hypothetical protein